MLYKIKKQLKKLQLMIESGESLKSCDSQAGKVTRPVMLSLLDNFENVWFEGVLDGISCNVLGTLKHVQPNSRLSDLGFEKYHKNLRNYLRNSEDEKKFRKVILICRRIGKLVSDEGDRALVKNKIQEIESLLARKKKRGQIIETYR